MTDTAINPIISQLKMEEEQLASLGSKLEKTAQWMMEASGTPEFSDRQDVYYPLLNEWREQKEKVNALYVKRADLPCIGEPTSLTAAAKVMEEKRAIREATVTSTTYERAQRRLFKQVNGFLSGR
ncbi:hypothetical protein [Vibrio sp. 1180_3]|uniref:hypothetical protein n=1 Tax=Vibrio sp. 1180_3 TaxID=2528832 RepID=UPI0024064AFF|nr:hypothetical protein [Vibrio sp. 1180_3]MDF9399093.1 hypothetical protein [Vibrio sp. 1180_3]